MEDMQETLVGLFTEVAILEHLVRVREERLASDLLSVGDFGVLNYFMVNHPSPDTVAGIAWCFQEEPVYTRAKVDDLLERGLVSITPHVDDNNVATVMITDKGRSVRDEVVERLAPDITMAVGEIPREALETTFKTLRDIRLTLDNLPDR
jgi:DNA-binding MarR family transcriptional regulator